MYLRNLFLPSTFVILTALGASIGELAAQSMRPFVPRDFKIPEKLETEKFRLRMLTVNDVVKDYDAVMTSIDHLRGAFGPRSRWPSPDLTLEQDLIDLGWHQKEFQRRSSFAYTVMNLSESQCLGCVYIDPTPKQGYDVEVALWVRKSEFDKGLDSLLYKAVKKWVAEKWPFKNVAYPGRDIEWETWEAIPFVLAQTGEVWTMEEKYWQYVQAGDVENYLALWHEDFVGWPTSALHPSGKANIGDWVRAIRDDNIQITYKLHLEAEQYFGDVAVVHYSTTVVRRFPDGRVTGEGRLLKFTHTWMRSGDQWQIISGMSGPVEPTR